MLDRHINEVAEALYHKLLEVDEKLDALMNHLGIAVPSQQAIASEPDDPSEPGQVIPIEVDQDTPITSA